MYTSLGIQRVNGPQRSTRVAENAGAILELCAEIGPILMRIAFFFRYLPLSLFFFFFFDFHN